MSRRLWALLRKELRTLFASPIAYLVLTAFVALSGIYFFQHLLVYNRLLFVFHSGALSSGSFDSGAVPLSGVLFVAALTAALPVMGGGLPYMAYDVLGFIP